MYKPTSYKQQFTVKKFGGFVFCYVLLQLWLLQGVKRLEYFLTC